MLDAIWLTLMEDTGVVKQDKLGRRRSVKKRVKKPVMIAWGIWPEESRKRVLDWEVGDGRGEDSENAAPTVASSSNNSPASGGLLLARKPLKATIASADDGTHFNHRPSPPSSTISATP
jgi:hypothetical protein